MKTQEILCPICGTHLEVQELKLSSAYTNQGRIALFLARNHHLWKNLKIRRMSNAGYGLRLTAGFKELVLILKHEGFYSKNTFNWDIPLEKIIKKAKEIMRRKP